MSLISTINQDLKTALKSKDSKKAAVLRFILAQVKNKEIEARTGGAAELSDEEVLQILKREVKKRKEAIELFKKSGRADLAEKELEEIGLIEGYLPKEMGRDEVKKVVEEVMSGNSFDFGTAMKAVMGKLEGRADGKIVSELVKERLAKEN